MASRPSTSQVAQTPAGTLGLRDGRDAKRPEDFPRGYAEPETADSFTPVLLNLAGTKIFDAGIRHYGEFFAGLNYAWDLINRATVSCDGRPGRVTVCARYENAIQLKWQPL